MVGSGSLTNWSPGFGFVIQDYGSLRNIYGSETLKLGGSVVGGTASCHGSCLYSNPDIFQNSEIKGFGGRMPLFLHFFFFYTIDTFIHHSFIRS
jgi:hypothetical protein